MQGYKSNHMSKKYPCVTVVIPAYNEEKFIGTALKSLQGQDYPGEYDVIVVNNASTDHTAAIAGSLGAKVIDEPRKGVQYARQTGFLAASGEYIASTDADNTLPSDWIRRLANNLEANQEWAAVGGWFVIRKGPPYLRFLINHLSTPTLLFYRLLGITNTLIAQNFMVRKSAFIACGGFDLTTSMHEDTKLAQRLATVGKVKFYYGMRWAVVSSPRRFNNGLVSGVLKYAVNGITYALARKIVFTELTDVREERAPTLVMPWLVMTIVTFSTITIAYVAMPLAPVQAKIEPFKQKAERTFKSSIAYMNKPLHIDNFTAEVSQFTRELR